MQKSAHSAASDFSLHLESTYTTAVSNALAKNLLEVKEKVPTNYTLTAIWKRRYREFLLNKNNKLLEFLTCKIKVHPVLGSAESFFQKFGKEKLNQNQQTIREIVFDLSGSTNEIMNLCIENEIPTPENYMKHSEFYLNLYKTTIDSILNKEDQLKLKLDNLDSIQKRLQTFSTLSQNEFYEPMLEVIEKYIGKIYEENDIEKTYKDIIELYRTFFCLRDIIHISNMTDSSEREPICTICFKDPVSFVFSPCGHTFCSNCVKKQLSNCGLCRSMIRDRIKIYFS